MGFSLSRAALMSLAICCCSVVADPIATLEDTKVTYRGVTEGKVEHFLNIKFAHDTSGSRRFAPPEPYSPPEGSEIEAVTPGPACSQSEPAIPPFFVATPDTSEDCLHLRVSRPAGTASGDKLPVVVWISGGGVVKGSGYDPHCDPDKLLELSLELEKPVIYASFNYRLTIFGFAQLPLLREQKSMNAGMRDQRLALQWIKDHISSFGGDPERITVFGLSAGGTFPSLHLVSYGGEQGVPFSQLWAMSGPPGNAVNMTSDVIETHTRAVAVKLGCGTDSDEETLECLRAVPEKQLTAAAMEYAVSNHPPHGLHTFIPSIDGDFMPDRMSVLYKSGRLVKDIPIVYGWTQDDAGTMAVPAARFQSEEDMKTAFEPFAHALTDDDYERLFALYPAADFEEELANYEARKDTSDPDAPIHFFRVRRMLRDLLFTCSSIGFGYEMSRQSRDVDPAFPGVRVYHLNQSMLAPMMAAVGMPYLGTCHGSDANYIFNGLFLEGSVSDPDQKLSRSMTGSFLHFAYTGNPTFPGDSELGSWPEAFPNSPEMKGDRDHAMPPSMNLQVVGGPYGAGSVHIRAGVDDADLAVMEGMVIEDTVYGEMGSAVAEERRRLIESEKLLERCAYVDTLNEKLGI
ncbi:alpha/beta-hydrolase [Hypoxylon sp. FL1150]|nr:alpha/beta-hydrolase [Hypoxylon sp. FL1150]